MKKVVIVSAVRTPIGSFMGALSSVPAPQLGAIAIKGALNKINLDPALVNEVYMGNVVQSGVGQAPARQAAIFAGLSNEVACTTINKVCASGMKSVMLGAQAIMCGDAEIVVAGGMENMSLIPHYVHLRNGVKFGPASMIDGMQKDGLVDPYDQQAMGVFADLCATEYKITREDQDNFAIQSYERSAKAWDAGKFDNEIVPVSIPQRKGDPIVVSKDEEYSNVKLDRIPTLNAVFTKDGTVTAANASTINDGAAAMVLMSEVKALSLGLKPLAYIKGYADAAQEPKWFTMLDGKSFNSNLGWNSKEFTDWCNNPLNKGSNPLDFPTFKEKMFIPFKQSIQVRVGQLPIILGRVIRKAIGNIGNATILEDNLKGTKFFTNVEMFESGLRYIFVAMKEHINSNSIISISIQRNVTINNIRFRVLKITHIGSIVNNNSFEEIIGGDLIAAKERFTGLCNWSIQAKFEDGFFEKRILKDTEIPEIESIESVEGFTHLLYFYA